MFDVLILGYAECSGIELYVDVRSHGLVRVICTVLTGLYVVPVYERGPYVAARGLGVAC